LAIIAVLFVNWLFGIKIEGWWMFNKTGLNIWDIWFEKGVYWYVPIAFALLLMIANPVFWKSRTLYLARYVRYILPPRWGEEEKKTPPDSCLGVKKGLALWGIKGLIGSLIGFAVGHGLATQYLLADAYLKMNNLSWLEFIQRMYLPAVTYFVTGKFPTGKFLIDNTVIFDFIPLITLPLTLLCLYWTYELTIASIIQLFKKNWVRPFRNIILIIFIWGFGMWLVSIPRTLMDIATPIFIGWRAFGAATLAIVIVGLTFSERLLHPLISKESVRFVPVVAGVFLLLIIVLTAPTAQSWYYYHWTQNWEANKYTFVFPYQVTPHMEYVKWTNSLPDIQKALTPQITTPSGREVEILSNVRLLSYAAAIKQMTYSYGKTVGQPWMKLSLETRADGSQLYGPMIVWANGHEYWVCPTSPVLPEQTDVEVGKKFLYTHSEVILAVDAATAEAVSIEKVFPKVNASTLTMYYGVGGLFKEQDMVYLRIGDWKETHLPTYKGSPAYVGIPDYVFGEAPLLPGISERFWFFFLRGEWAFAQGTYGSEISVIRHRNIEDRVNKLLIGGLSIEKEPATNSPNPYIVADDKGNLYYEFSIYTNKSISSPYTDTRNVGEGVITGGEFRRAFAIVLVNVHDGTVYGYRYGDWDEHYITKFYASFYPAWDNPVPAWLSEQIRYPKSLMQDLVDLYNVYHIDSRDYDSWYKTLNMYDLPTDRNWKPFTTQFDDIRYIPVFFNGVLRYVAIRTVELYQQKSTTWIPRSVAGAYVFFGDGKKFIVPFSEKVLGLQLILDSVRTNPEVQYVLTTRRQMGQSWEEGNLIEYFIGERLVFFIPYYTSTETLMNIVMVVAVDGATGNIGYYVLQDPRNSEELKVASLRAYSMMMKGAVLLGEKERIDVVSKEFTKLGFTVRTPLELNPTVTYSYANVTFHATQDWSAVNATLRKFVADVCAPNKVATINLWARSVGPTRIIYAGALIQTNQGTELHLLAIDIGTGS